MGNASQIQEYIFFIFVLIVLYMFNLDSKYYFKTFLESIKDLRMTFYCSQNFLQTNVVIVKTSDLKIRVTACPLSESQTHNINTDR